jgi:hypothetical protein
MATNWRIGNTNGTKPEDPVADFKNLGKDVVNGLAAEIDQAINKSMAIREAEAFGNPGQADIKVRREGFIFRHDNPEDRKRFEAKKANRDRGYLTADHLNLVGGFVARGQQFVLDVGEHLLEDAHNRPAEEQPIAKTLTKASMKILSAAYIESLQFLAERGFQTVDRATPPDQQQQ